MDGLWLGATDVGHEGTFIWQSSGKPLSFTDWFYFISIQTIGVVMKIACSRISLTLNGMMCNVINPVK
jgi:hypothetical protein